MEQLLFTGSYLDTLTNMYGCDSVTILILKIYPVVYSTTDDTICDNQLPYVWNGNNYSVPGTYSVTLTSSHGCDSIATLNLTVHPVVYSTTNDTICDDQLPYVWNGNNYTATGSIT